MERSPNQAVGSQLTVIHCCPAIDMASKHFTAGFKHMQATQADILHLTLVFGNPN